jgi:predicted alpha/beta hydrolase
MMIKSRETSWAGHVAHMWKMKNVHKILVGKPEGKISFKRQWRRWENNKMVFKETVSSVDWTDLVHGTDSRTW